MARQPKYSGDLAKPMPPKPAKPSAPRPAKGGGLLGDPRPEHEKALVAAAWAAWDDWRSEFYRRLELLAEFYGIALDEPDAVGKLLLALAEAHVPGLRQSDRPQSSRSAGRPNELDSQEAKDARSALMFLVFEKKRANPRLSYEAVYKKLPGAWRKDLPPYYRNRTKLAPATLKDHFQQAKAEAREHHKKILELAQTLSAPPVPFDLSWGLFGLGGIGMRGGQSAAGLAQGRGLLTADDEQPPVTKRGKT